MPNKPTDALLAAMNSLGFITILIFSAGILAGILIQWRVGC